MIFGHQNPGSLSGFGSGSGPDPKHCFLHSLVLSEACINGALLASGRSEVWNSSGETKKALSSIGYHCLLFCGPISSGSLPAVLKIRMNPVLNTVGRIWSRVRIRNGSSGYGSGSGKITFSKKVRMHFLA